MKLYIARDQSYTEYEYETDDYGIKVPGKLHIFYDIPEYIYHDAEHVGSDMVYSRTGYFYWGNARCIGEIPSYMYPEIEEGKCIIFESK